MKPKATSPTALAPQTTTSRRGHLRLLGGGGLLGASAVAAGLGGVTTALPGSALAAPAPAASARLEGMIFTRWRADPWALGAYSYISENARARDRLALGSPVGDRLFFAGEATDRDCPATVHGALQSGWDAAERLAGIGPRRDGSPSSARAFPASVRRKRSAKRATR